MHDDATVDRFRLSLVLPAILMAAVGCAGSGFFSSAASAVVRARTYAEPPRPAAEVALVALFCPTARGEMSALVNQTTGETIRFAETNPMSLLELLPGSWSVATEWQTAVDDLGPYRYSPEPLFAPLVVEAGRVYLVVLDIRPDGLWGPHVLDVEPDGRCVERVPPGGNPFEALSAETAGAVDEFCARELPGIVAEYLQGERPVAPTQ